MQIIPASETIEEFLDRFERCYKMVTASSSTANIPEEIRAFMVLKRANVTDTQRMLILSKMNLDEKNKMFGTICKELKLVLGGGPGQQNVSGAIDKKDAISVEAIKAEDDVFITFNGTKCYRDGFRGRGRGGGQSRGGQSRGGRGGKPYD